MDLPAEVKPSRLSPHFVKGYVLGLLGVPVVLALVGLAVPYLDFLPFPVWYLYGLAVLPLAFTVLAEVRRHEHTYIFHEDRVMVQRGEETIYQEDVPYSKITGISSVTPPFEEMVDVGDLEVHIAGSDASVNIIGVKHPQQWEDLMLGRLDAGEARGSDAEQEQGGEGGAQDIRQELQELERLYDDGRIGRAEYERRYYYLRGKLDVLEGG